MGHMRRIRVMYGRIGVAIPGPLARERRLNIEQAVTFLPGDGRIAFRALEWGDPVFDVEGYPPFTRLHLIRMEYFMAIPDSLIRGMRLGEGLWLEFAGDGPVILARLADIGPDGHPVEAWDPPSYEPPRARRTRVAAGGTGLRGTLCDRHAHPAPDRRPPFI